MVGATADDESTQAGVIYCCSLGWPVHGIARYPVPLMPVSKKRKTSKPQTQDRLSERDTPGSDVPESPSWYAPVMVVLMALGVITVIATYILGLPRTFLLPGLGALAVGMFMTMAWK
jgi:hypothetical protein